MFAACVLGFVLAAMFFNSRARAEEKMGSTVYVTAGIGVANFNTDVGVMAPGPVAGVDGLGADGIFGSLGGGVDMSLGGKMVVGVFADYDFHTAEFKAGAGSLSLSSKIKDQWTVGGRLGYRIMDPTLVYGLFGYTQARYDDINVGGGVFSPGSFNGYVVGAGIETEMSKTISLALEYRHSMFEDKSYAIGGPIALNLDPTEDSVRGVIKLKFNPF